MCPGAVLWGWAGTGRGDGEQSAVPPRQQPAEISTQPRCWSLSTGCQGLTQVCRSTARQLGSGSMWHLQLTHFSTTGH